MAAALALDRKPKPNVAECRGMADETLLLGVSIETTATLAAMALTTVALYRVGTGSSAQLDKLRNRDVEIYTDPACREICVRITNTTGVSCYDNSTALAGLNGRMWELPANSDYDDTHLLLWRDDPDSDHWNWTPARDMPGSEFLEAIRDVNAKFSLLP